MTTIKVELAWTLDGQTHSQVLETELKAQEGPIEGFRRATMEALESVEAKTFNW